MGIIDFPLLDGLHEENDNKLGKPSTLISCNNFYYQLIGRLAVRGGFQGGASDEIATGAYGVPRHSVEKDDGTLSVLTDTCILKHNDAGAQGAASSISASSVCQDSKVTLDVPLMYNSTAYYDFSNGVDFALVGTTEYVATGGALWSRTVGARPWTVLSGLAYDIDNVQALAPHTTLSGAGVVLISGPEDTSVTVATFAAGAVRSSTTVTATIYSAQPIAYGTGSIVAILTPTKLKLIHLYGNTIDAKVDWTHSLSLNYGCRVRCSVTGSTLWVVVYDSTSQRFKCYRWDIPTPNTNAWSASPDATVTPAVAVTGVPSSSSDVAFDVGPNGILLWAHCPSTAGASDIQCYKWNLATDTQIAWYGGTNAAGVSCRPAWLPISKIFQVTGLDGYWVFALSPCPSFEPGCGVLLCRFADSATPAWDGEVTSIAAVQVASVRTNPTYFSGNGNRACLAARNVTVSGSTVYFPYIIESQLSQALELGTWTIGKATERNCASGGAVTIASRTPVEVQDYGDTPSWCAIKVWSVTECATAGSTVAGTYSVRFTIEADTPDGLWQSAASLPVAVTVAASKSISANITAMGYPHATASGARLVAYVAPPGSTTYYRSGEVRAPTGSVANRHFYTTTATLLASGATTTGEILYELAEPPHVYPGDAAGVAWANGRLWRWRGYSLWFTHATVAGLATQWAGDELRIDFNGTIEGVGQLQGQPVVITSDAVWLLGGDGPDRSGAGGYELRQLASVPLGCLDQRSVVETPAGLCWASVRGIEMVPAGGGIPVSVGQPVRETVGGVSSANAPGGFVLGAHSQARSMAVWFSANANPLDQPNAVCFDYLRGVWFTWKVPFTATGVISCAGAWGASFAYYDYNAGAAKSYGQFDCKLLAGAVQTKYPVYSLDNSGSAASTGITASFATGDVRVSGSQTNAVWRGVWLLGALGRVPTAGGIVYTCEQTADGAVQTEQFFPYTGGADVTRMRSMALFPVSNADGVSILVKLAVTEEYGPGYATNGGPPTISALSFDYDATGNLSRLGSGNRS